MGSRMGREVLPLPGSPSAWKSWPQVIFGTIAWPGFKNVLGWFLEEPASCQHRPGTVGCPGLGWEHQEPPGRGARGIRSCAWSPRLGSGWLLH